MAAHPIPRSVAGPPVALGKNAEPAAERGALPQEPQRRRLTVFFKDDDYRGSPDMTKHPLLRKYLLENFSWYTFINLQQI